MRRVTIGAGALLAVLALAACKREPTFEERYAGAEKAIREKAGELDKDLARRAAEAQATSPDPLTTHDVAQDPPLPQGKT
jgi:hypothetical protein